MGADVAGLEAALAEIQPLIDSGEFMAASEKAVAIKPSMQRRFIFITGDMNSLTSQQINTVTDNPCLLKPVNIEKIESTIRQVLSGQPPTDRIAVSRN